MNILITDDERLVRVNLISMLEELYPGKNNIAQARNGKEMLESIKNNFYDIVFLDINMPVMNGLDALETCRQISPETWWCILTGYAEFKYAKRAISLGVTGYLLKPLDIEELRKLVDEIFEKKEEKLQNLNQIFANKMSQAIALADSTKVIKQMQPSKKGSLYSIYLFFVDTAEFEKRQKIYGKLYEELLQYLKVNIAEQDRYALFFLQTGELCLLIEGNEYEKLQAYLKLHGKDIDGKARIIAIWSSAREFSDLYMNKQIILGMSSIRILEKTYEIISLQKLNKQKDLLEKQYFCEKIEMLTAAYMTENYGLANELIQKMEQEEDLRDCFDKIEQDSLFDYLSIIWKSDFEGESFSSMLHHFQKMIQNGQLEEQGGKNDVILSIKEYVAANYMNDLTIAEIGNRFGISPSYISRIFKEKTGDKYIDFVTAVRMKKAREFLQNNPAMTVKEVAALVGYVSEKHFSKTFKKYFTCLPSQVRNQGI